ncbi:1-acyl-sn-glycerol-3-phosphate acyltransferase [Candidatus Saccharibacteria bacterium]|nr:1-acyl-sn-glycerol-3-phosphate acyltransferase [Candidatus Saccharibacteria bacterium]
MANILESYRYKDAGHPLLYGVAHFAVGQFLKYNYDLEIFGAQYLTRRGPRVYAGTHTRALDPGVKGVVTQEPIPTMAKSELWTEDRYRKYGVHVGQIISLVDAFPVRRGEVDRDAIRTGNEHLENGTSIGIFSQGTRSLDFENLLDGAAMFACSHSVDVQPLVIATHLDEESNSERELIRVIASSPIGPDRTKRTKDARKYLTQQLSTRFIRDYPRAVAWSAHDAKYKNQIKSPGIIKRYK